MKRIAISQSNYLPWKGYFHVIGSVDEFVLYDEVQYTKRDWRNRNRIKTPKGLTWLTVPVNVKGRFEQRIDETTIADAGWATSHWDKITAAYSRAPYFEELRETFETVYHSGTRERLSDVNRDLLELVMGLLDIETPLSWSTDYPHEAEGKTERLLSICQQSGASEYWSGPAARAYLDESQFERAGVTVRYVDYSGFPEYEQMHGEFRHDVSIVDLLFNAGTDSRPLLKLSADR